MSLVWFKFEPVVLVVESGCKLASYVEATLRTETRDEKGPITDENLEHVLELAERLRESNGGELDDNAILAVAEATGAPVDYVRVAVRLRGERKKQTLTQKIRTEFLQLDPDTRQYVFAAVGAATSSFANALGFRMPANGLFGILALLLSAATMIGIANSRNSRVASGAGAIFGGTFFALYPLFNLILFRTDNIAPVLIIPSLIVGALSGLILHGIMSSLRPKLGMKDPSKERQDMLRQLVNLQEQLRSGERSMTFLSVDIVGSTRMKEMADPLNVEFTFTEYHHFVELIARKHGGSVHSTAGDGVICAFENPVSAFAAAKNLQTGLIELNTFRNKIGTPIVLRAGIHSGEVVMPEPGDLTSLNFAHVIDMASHVQKVCPPGGVAVSQLAAAHLPGGSKGVGDQATMVDKMQVSIWMPRRSVGAS